MIAVSWLAILVTMRARPDPFDKVRKAAVGLPDVTEATAWGAPALKVGGQMFACMATNRQAEPNSLVARLSFVDRDWLIAQNPDVYYLKPHYVDYPCVVVRLHHINPKDMRELLVNAREFVASMRKTSSRRRAGSR